MWPGLPAELPGWLPPTFVLSALGLILTVVVFYRGWLVTGPQHTKAIERIDADHAAELGRRDAELKRLKDEHVAAVERMDEASGEIRAAHMETIRELRAEHARELAAVREQYAQAYQRREEEHAAELQRRADTLQRQVDYVEQRRLEANAERQDALETAREAMAASAEILRVAQGIREELIRGGRTVPEPERRSAPRRARVPTAG